MLLAVEIIGIVTMCVLISVSVLGFIILKQIINQLKYKNYLLEKLNLHIYNLSTNLKLKENIQIVVPEKDEFNL
ncbi:hypothetical protein KQI86_13585 [Clostridium sp. MSJ-11]|uniref:Uncharacterized protein n=1 Tax=Clostridium mobile TaxID=2841512 RepID=A0ABS6EJH7_9CLOT|nr:hypothetical protein [Clostridium mobile]MBU5485370.1 hypothetical protein [Clostridium mobile]